MMDLSFSSALRSTVALLGTLLVGGMLATAAHGQVAQSSALFLRIEPDSRASGLGTAGVATADNANAVFWNPAALGFQEGPHAAITHADWLPPFNADYHSCSPVGT